MSLQEKALRLELEGALAVRHARWWRKQIETHGEEKATAFYKSLGLNHLDVTVEVSSPKSSDPVEIILRSDGSYAQAKAAYEWEGLTLSREPTEAEKICVKGIAGAQESSKEKIGKILLELRSQLISDGLKGIRKLKPSTYHELTLTASPESRESLRDRLIKVHRQGRMLVAAELGTKEAVPKDDFDLLDDLVDITDSRVVNDVQARIAAAATRYRLLGLKDAALWKAVEDEIRLGSVSYIDRAATGVGNRVLNIGRMDEMRSRADSIDRYEQSEILDQNTCGPCAEDDGKEADDPADLPGAPNPSCEGGDYCRGFIVAIAEGNM